MGVGEGVLKNKQTGTDLNKTKNNKNNNKNKPKYHSGDVLAVTGWPPHFRVIKVERNSDFSQVYTW